RLPRGLSWIARSVWGLLAEGDILSGASSWRAPPKAQITALQERRRDARSFAARHFTRASTIGGDRVSNRRECPGGVAARRILRRATSAVDADHPQRDRHGPARLRAFRALGKGPTVHRLSLPTVCRRGTGQAFGLLR